MLKQTLRAFHSVIISHVVVCCTGTSFYFSPHNCSMGCLTPRTSRGKSESKALSQMSWPTMPRKGSWNYF